MRKEEITIEVIGIYVKDKNQRAIIPRNEMSDKSLVYCQYQTSDGRMCAVGHCLKPDEDVYSFQGDVAGMAVDLTESGRIDELLKDEYHGHDVQFWTDLQNIHDSDRYWTSDRKYLKDAIALLCTTHSMDHDEVAKGLGLN